jgi:hypothetical protein
MNEFYIVDGKIYEVSPSKKEEFLQKFPNAVIRTEEVAKTAGVERGYSNRESARYGFQFGKWFFGITRTN